MKTYKLDEIRYEEALETIAKSLIAMAQEDYADDFKGKSKKEIKEQLTDVVEEYSGDMLLQLKDFVTKHIKLTFARP